MESLGSGEESQVSLRYTVRVPWDPNVTTPWSLCIFPDSDQQAKQKAPSSAVAVRSQGQWDCSHRHVPEVWLGPRSLPGDSVCAPEIGDSGDGAVTATTT